ncbi:hypothetical protein GCM10011576_54900 [Micromonospora parathelypteridis]|nr:hypothetical protein GCM10011576_54900 [Micromonospora parathelypteridis]
MVHSSTPNILLVPVTLTGTHQAGGCPKVKVKLATQENSPAAPGVATATNTAGRLGACVSSSPEATARSPYCCNATSPGAVTPPSG